MLPCKARLNRTVTGARSRGWGWCKAGLGLGRGLHRRLTRRGVERGGRGRRHTHPQHGEGTARRRARQRDSLQEGGEEREGGQRGEWKTNRGDARAC